MTVAGGAVAAAYQGSGVDLTPVLAANIGASAPLILTKASRSLPEVELGKTG
jgi:hypothetical protein